MDFREFSRENIARCTSASGFNHSLSSWSLSDWMTAVVGEIGEAANIVKKLNRVRDGIVGNTETPEQLHAALADELADVDIYLDLLYQAAGIDRVSAIRHKFDRTSAKIGYVTSNPPSPSAPPGHFGDEFAPAPTPDLEHIVRESLTSFLVDPPDTDWQRGYLAALLFILNTGLGLPQTDLLYVKADALLK